MATVSEQEVSLPAYVPYSTLKNFIERLKESGIPSRIDKTVMSYLAGGTQGPLAGALRYLGLTTTAGEPTDKLKSLVETSKTSRWSPALHDVLLSAYAPILGGIDLKSATPGQLEEKFREVGKVSGSTLEKSIRFYLQAAKDGGVALSSHLVNIRKPRTTRKPSPRTPKNGEAAAAETPAVSLLAEKPVDAEMREFPVYFKGKKNGKIVVPSNIAPSDCKMFTIALQMVEAYAEQHDGDIAE